MPQGPIALNSSIQKSSAGNVRVPTVVDAQSALTVADRHGSNYEAAYASAIGLAANSAGVTTSIALATTYLGLCLSNPAASGKNLSVLRVSALLEVAPAALTAFGYITGYVAAGIVTHTTALTVQNANIGVTTPALVGLADSACTLVGTPIWSHWVAVTPSATGVVSFNESVDGAILIPPGGYLAIGTSIAGPASGFLGSIVWEENAI